MTNWDRFFRAAFVALAVGLGWGIRGDFGGFEGAMYPAACLGLAFAYVSGQPGLFQRMPVLGALAALFIGMGGMMSYGVLHGYAKADTFINYSYGYFTLFLQGGAWGVFGCAVLGLVLEDKPPKWHHWLSLTLAVAAGAALFYAVVVMLLGFQINPPRGNTSIAFTGGAIGLFLWLVYHPFPYGLRGAMLGYLGFGTGMFFGRFLGNATYHLPWAINHWNVMEVSVGIIGGFVFAWGMLGKAVPERKGKKEPPFAPFWTLLSMNLVLIYIPMVHLITRARTDRRLAEWTERLVSYGYPEAEALSMQIYTWTALVAATGIVAVPLWYLFHIQKRFLWAAFPVMALSAIMLLFQNLTALYFYYPSRPMHINMHFIFWVLFSLMLVYAVVRGRHEPLTEKKEHFKEVHWKPWCAAAGVCMLIALILSAVVNGEKTMASANTRFPVWSWNDPPPISEENLVDEEPPPPMPVPITQE